jgi:hypothetical protein
MESMRHLAPAGEGVLKFETHEVSQNHLSRSGVKPNKKGHKLKLSP